MDGWMDGCITPGLQEWHAPDGSVENSSVSAGVSVDNAAVAAVEAPVSSPCTSYLRWELAGRLRCV
jgi:hypothetical protein